MSEEIKPDIKDGIGYHNKDCTHYTQTFDGWLCEHPTRKTVTSYRLCIPWLRQQLTELAGLREKVKELEAKNTAALMTIADTDMEKLRAENAELRDLCRLCKSPLLEDEIDTYGGGICFNCVADKESWDDLKEFKRRVEAWMRTIHRLNKIKVNRACNDEFRCWYQYIYELIETGADRMGISLADKDE